MAETKLIADANSLSAWFALPNAFANPEKPTPAELNASVYLGRAIAWDGYSFGAQASNQSSDPGWDDTGNTQTRGFAQFGGTIAFYYPKNYTDTSDDSYIVFEALDQPLTDGYIIIRVDGQKTTAGVADKTTPALSNDFVAIFKIISDGYSDTDTGEVAFKYNIEFLAQGDIWINAVVATTVTVATPAAIGAADYTVDGKTPLGAYVTGRQLAAVAGEWSGYPGWFDWESSDSSVASVDANGVVHGVSAGTAEITAIHKVSRAESTALSVTIV